jgi:glycosyltransferase involved in cell wall biosynthesis
MHVAHIGDYKPHTSNGVNKTVAALARHTPNHGIQVELWHFTARANGVRERVVDGVQIFDLPIYSQRWLRTIRLPAETARFLRLRRRDVDVLHLHSAFAPENLWAANLGVPYVVTPNGAWSLSVIRGRRRFMKWAWLQLWENRLWRRARVIHAVSRSELDDLVARKMDVPVEYIPNGVDDDDLAREVSPPSAGTVWLYLGRLAVKQKGLDLLLQAYAIARSTVSVPLPPLVIAGPDFRGGLEELTQLSESLGLEQLVRFIGPVRAEARGALVSTARLFVHTSRWEGMPFAVLEALAAERPVLVTNAANLTHEIESHSAGWIAQETPAAIAEHLLKAATIGPVTLDAMGRRGRQMVREHLAWKPLAGRIAALYKTAVEQ